MTTRDKILTEALNQFSVKGYDPVSVRDIAYAVGIKESSLYNHFKNKQDIFDSIINEYSHRWEEIFYQIQLTGVDQQIVVDNRTVNMYKNMSNEQFTTIAGYIFDYYMTDDINVKLRRMLTIEQYRNEHIVALFRKISFDDSIEFQAKLFEELIREGCFIQTDPYQMALAFFAPIFLIFYKFDHNAAGIQAGKQLFLEHIDHFNKTYSVMNQPEDEKL